MITITLSHQKGGVGKSTLSLALYSFLSKEEINVALYDHDPQGSIREAKKSFEEDSNDWKNLNLVPKTNDLETLRELDYDVLIIDTPPYLSTQLPIAFKQSDLIIFPCKPSPFDALAIQNSLKLLKDVNCNAKSAIILTMVDGKTNMQEDIRDIINEFDTQIFETEIHNRVSYTRTLLFSNSIFASPDKKAIQEVESFGQEVLNLLEES